MCGLIILDSAWHAYTNFVLTLCSLLDEHVHQDWRVGAFHFEDVLMDSQIHMSLSVAIKADWQRFLCISICSVRSFLLLVVRPGAPILAPSSDARSP